MQHDETQPDRRRRPPDDRSRTALQVEQLRRQAEPELARRQLGFLVDRRQETTREPDELPGARLRPALALLPRSDGGPVPVPVVAGEVLVRDVDDEGVRGRVQELLEGAGFRPDDKSEAHPGVRRWRSADAGQSRLEEVLRAAAADGLPVTAHHVGMLAHRMKGQCSPEHADSPPAGRRRAAPGPGDPLVVVVDTGLDEAAPRRSDGWLADVEVAPQDVDPLDVVDDTLTPVPGGNERLDLGAGHGTFVAGVVRRVAPDAQVVAVRALDTDGVGSEADVADAIQRAATVVAGRGGRGVLNLSFGMSTVDGRPPAALTAALDALPASLTVVAAAGNDGGTEPVWPAASPRVLGVAALDTTGAPARWSDSGPWVDFSVRGEGVVSTFVAGTEEQGAGPEDPFDEEPECFPAPGQEEPWALWTGTSFAAPAVSAWLATWLAQNPGGGVGDAAWALRQQGTLHDGYGWAVDVPLRN